MSEQTEGRPAQPGPQHPGSAGEDRFRAIVDGFGDPILIADSFQIVRYVNAAFLRAFGYGPAEVIGAPLANLLPPEELPAVYARFTPPGLPGEPACIGHSLIRRDGGVELVETRANALPDPAGQAMAIMHMRVVTEERLHARVQALHFAVTRILAESPDLGAALARATGAIAANLGWQMAELWLPGGAGRELRLREAWLSAPSPELESFASASRPMAFPPGAGIPGRSWASGRVLWEADAREAPLFQRGQLAAAAGLRTVVAVPIAQDSVVAGVMVFFSQALRPLDSALEAILADLGRQLGQFVARKQAEADLVAERASLAQRVEERTADLRRANADLARALGAKDEFLATMSHELRTPLNTILAVGEVLLEGLRGPLTDEQRAAVLTIETSGRHLLTLINDILDLAKVEAGRLELDPETVAVDEICRISLMFVRELAVRKQLRLSLVLDDEEALIEADARRLKQILVNLLSNAVKFTPPGGEVTLEVATRGEDGRILFAVADTGIGIAEEDLGRLFQPFTQLDAGLRRQHEGTGLGLSLVARLVALQGGEVRVESAPGRGSRFTVALPAGRAAPPGGL